MPETLTRCALFGGVDVDRCGFFAQAMQQTQVCLGEAVYEEGEPARHLYLVDQGQFSVVRREQGRTVELNRLGPGDFFGDMSFIDMQVRSASVRALEDGVVWALPYSALREVYKLDLKCYTIVVMNIAREMSRRLRRADRERGPAPTTRPAITPSTGIAVVDVIRRLGLRNLPAEDAQG